MVCHSRASRALPGSFFVLTDAIAIGAATDSTDVFMPTASHRYVCQGLMQVKDLEFFRIQEKSE